MPFSRGGGISSSSPGREAKQSRRGEGEGPTSEGESSADRWWLWGGEVGGAAWASPLNASFPTFSRREFGFWKRCRNVTTFGGTTAMDVFASAMGRISGLLRASRTDRQTKRYRSLRRSPLSCGLTVRVQERAEPSGPMTGRWEEMHSERWRGSHPPHIIVKCSRRMQTTA